jgi:hypothetical protein
VQFDPIRGTLSCYRSSCDYEEHVDVSEYLYEHDVLPKLAKSLELNGYKSIIRVKNR